jgi:hypothetical protein
MKAIALLISVVSARFAPWRGRSDAMILSGLPLPPYWSFPHDDDGNGVTDVRECDVARPLAAKAPSKATPRKAPPANRRTFVTSPPFELTDTTLTQV